MCTFSVPELNHQNVGPVGLQILSLSAVFRCPSISVTIDRDKWKKYPEEPENNYYSAAVKISKPRLVSRAEF